ncbi:Oidioi.mRNA.OKI2018_I69.PAR.g11742.t1.cds [Oikopleura dioica]|uniref:Oidioi.mRNA.OKI2018_I69.PAR.g11742.t1.cds n=1 Tax=Oikopleura dioica TaxID=34765 RepID=A0ABN7S3G6_OIKDI|nr:Oidioi.mRNA.OKI2018_I69.PAR.g11742.t1.cds [Oikopleura dioica]
MIESLTLSREKKDLFDNFTKLEYELFNLDNIEDLTYIPGGYAGLYLAVNMRNKPTEFLPKQVDERLLEALMNVDIERGTPASHIFVVAAFNHHFDLLTSSFWDKFSIDWSYTIGQHTVFMAPNEFVRRILVNNPYSKEDIYQLVHTMDDTFCFLIDRMLETVPRSRVCEIISKPNHVGLTSVFYASRMCYRFTKMLLDRLPELEFNQTCFFGNTVGLVFTPLIGRILERGMNPFIVPKYRRVVENFNFEIKKSMFEKYPELKDIQISTEKYFLSSQYDLFKKEVHEQADMKTLEQNWVTGYDDNELPLTTFYSSWYDIDGPEPTQRIKSMRYFPGKLIKKTEKLGEGGQGSVFKCLWHGKPAAAKYIKSKDVELGKYIMNRGSH